MMRTVFAIPLALSMVAAGCATNPDIDEDLLSNEFELMIGTDPESSDTDGDGYSDAYEHFTYFSPLRDNDVPYEEEGADYHRMPLLFGDDWDEVSDGAGWDEGDFSRSWTATDQFGIDLKLKRFYGQVILIDVSAAPPRACRRSTSSVATTASWPSRSSRRTPPTSPRPRLTAGLTISA
jgi:hypothetical protein